MKVTFIERMATGTMTLLTPPVKVEVEKYSHAAVGGPKRATLRVTGKAEDLLTFLDWLRVKVEIDNNGRTVWWGYIQRVEVELGRVRVSADLDRMYNRIAAAYTLVTAGQDTAGERETTAWVEDSTSIQTYGYKELLQSIADTTALGAEQARDRALASMKMATAGFEVGLSNEISATIECRGWWNTLDWRYCSVPTLLALAYETIGDYTQVWGNDGVEQIAQAFDAGSSINLQQIAVYMAKVGSPEDNVKLAIHANPDDVTIGDELTSATVSGAGLSTTLGWVTVSLASPYALTAGVSYWLVVSRSGAQDAANYYTTQLDPQQGYGAGPYMDYTTSWTVRGRDMMFRLYDNDIVETSQQVKSLITNFGQFLRRVRVEAPSGVSTESYRDGDTTALYEIERLLETGSTNDRRMLAEVNAARDVRIYEQAASGTMPHFINAMGEIFDPYGAPISKDTCPAGIWVNPKDILPTSALSYVGGLQAFFIEEMEYNAVRDELRFRAANLPDPFDLGVNDG